MGRIRTIKPEFHAHEDLSALPADTHLLAAALLNYADDFGYFNANPGLVKAGTHPLRVDAKPVSYRLAQLAKIGYIEIRMCAGGRLLGHIRNFPSHQKVSHPADSKLEKRYLDGKGNPPELFSCSPEDFWRALESLRPEQGTGNGTGNGEGEAPTANAVSADRGKLLGTLPLNDGSEYEVCEDDLTRDAQLYPAVDVRQAYRGMKAYLLANPAKAKTRKGIRKFMNNWLSRDQDRGGVHVAAHKPFTKHSNVDTAQQAAAIFASREAPGDHGFAGETWDSPAGEAGHRGLPRAS